MAENSEISWTHHTMNPYIGCSKVSEGCRNCYAEALNNRWGHSNWGPGKPRRVTSPANWRKPLLWNKKAAKAGERHRVFCASLADVFDAEAPEGALEWLWALIRATPNLDWLLLTKRPERIQGSLPLDWGEGYKNVLLGVTVENQEMAEIRIPLLLKVPAVRFLSCEPLLGPVDLSEWLWEERTVSCAKYEMPAGGIRWVIAGGESGPGARAMAPSWVKSLRDQCVAVDIAFHFKQWGAWAPAINNPGLPVALMEKTMQCVGKKAAGRLLDGKIWAEFP